MEFITQHPWRDLIRQPMLDAQLGLAIPLENSDWEYIDTEMAKLGTISHEMVNIPTVQDRILKLLSEETKDFRLLAHLLNTLQRGERTDSILLAIALLGDYVECWWNVAAPQKNKLRIAQTVLQRFTMAKEIFSQLAIAKERERAISEFVRLKLLWETHTPLCDELDKLIISYGKSSVSALPPESTLSPASDTQGNLRPAVLASTGTLPSVTLDDSSDRAWCKTLLKMAEIESTRSFATPIGFQLRRHAVWFNITALPASRQGVTTVPALPIEKISEFERELAQPTQALWLKVENTIAYSPYWFNGHYMSACIANKLGYPRCGDAIRNELLWFLARFPEYPPLCFANGEPFMNPQTQQWLQQKESRVSQDEHFTQVQALFDSEGLNAALTFIEQTTNNELRSLCYSQLRTIRLLHQAGCYKLAKQQLDNLENKAAQLSVREWEPSFFDSCNGLKDISGNKE